MSQSNDQPLAAAALDMRAGNVLSALSNADLAARIKGLIRIENRALAMLIAHLIEFDNRRLYADLGFSSLFAYCTRELGYSEDAACRRIVAARTAREFPEVVSLLETGRIHLAAIVAVAPHLTLENHAGLLAQACGRNRRELETLTAGLEPAADEPADSIREISPGRIAVAFASDVDFREQIDRARALFRHKHPSGRIELILMEALHSLLESKDPEFWNKPRKPATNRDKGGRNCRYIPKHVKEAVWKRDEGRCVFVGPTGLRCAERGWLEFDHIMPWARGGRSDDPRNIRLLCATHNQLMARREFGEAAARRTRKYPRQRG